jgi:site-specific DNA-methyltransferase (adenine-specific)
MAVAIEDAGFEIRDQIMWVYGSGFPKSHNISKGIDKAAGAEREVVSSYKGVTKGDGGRYNWHNTDEVGSTMVDVTIPATDAAKQWQGWGTALKPAHEPIVLARKPFNSTVANNVLTYGVGGINIDGTRVGNETVSVHHAPKGTFAGGEPNRGSDTSTYENHIGRWPANFIHDGSDEVNELLGEPARFFYCAKANKRDRNEGIENNHPTVKPTDLMQYLCRLITPPNGTILDPFLGSGSTGKAAMYEGFNFVGIELTQEYLPIAKARIEFALNNKNN